VEGVRDELLCLRVDFGELIVWRRDRVCAGRAWSGVFQRSRRACGL
jgi:hypothetical protein